MEVATLQFILPSALLAGHRSASGLDVSGPERGTHYRNVNQYALSEVLQFGDNGNQVY